MSECDIIYSVEDFLKALRSWKPKTWLIWIDIPKEKEEKAKKP